MKRAFTIQLVSYAPLLKAERMAFHDDEKTLIVGKIDNWCGFALFIACRTIDTPDMLKEVLPLLKTYQASFRLIKNQNLQYQLNSGFFGEEEAGKVVSIFPKTIDQCLALVDIITKLTEKFKGPIIARAQRIGRNIYVQAVANMDGKIKLMMPDVKNLPFNIPKEYLVKRKRNAIIGSFFLPVQMLSSSTKGEVYKAINLKRFSFSWCIIKKGNPVALDDHFDRDMKDRLQWQKEVIKQLSPNVYTPEFIDFFEKNDSCYLVLAHAEGEAFGQTIRNSLSGTQWKSLEATQQMKLIGFYLKVLDLITSVHGQEFVHRDITENNFLVMPDGSVCIIDFELSYSLKIKRPDPPFLLGTLGYAAPEQLRYELPDFKEDIYALGALLSFTISGCPPHEFLNGNLHSIKAKIRRLSGSIELAAITIRCLQNKQIDRPEITEIKNVVLKYLDNLTLKSHEKIAMAI